jgi:hypothetical protein
MATLKPVHDDFKMLIAQTTRVQYAGIGSPPSLPETRGLLRETRLKWRTAKW